MAGIREGILDLITGEQTSPYRGLLSPDANRRARNEALIGSSLAMIDRSTGSYLQPKPNFGSVLGAGLQTGREIYSGAINAELERQQLLQNALLAQRGQAMQLNLAQLFETEGVTPESLKKASAIASAYGDNDTALAFLERIQYVTPEPVEEPATTDDLIEYDRVVQQGYPGTFRDYMESKEPSIEPDRISAGDAANYEIKVDGEWVNVQPGMLLSDFQEYDFRLKEEAEAEETEKAQKDLAKKSEPRMRTVLTDNIVSAMGVLKDPGLFSTGTTRPIADFFGSQDAQVLANSVKTLKASVTLDSLQQLKKSGVSLGGTSEGELALLAAAIIELDANDDPVVLRDQLRSVYALFDQYGLMDQGMIDKRDDESKNLRNLLPIDSPSIVGASVNIPASNVFTGGTNQPPPDEQRR